MNTRMRVLILAAPLVASATLTGCNGNKTSTAAAPAPAPRSSQPTASTPATAPTTPSSAAATKGAKTCPANSTQGIINGASKCLAPGQMCSSKAINSYPQYGYVCENTNGKLILRRK